MARDGAGTYTFPVNSFNPAVADTDIDPDDWNSTTADLATALSASIAKDGQTVTTAAIPFASGVQTDTISEKTSAAGVTVDGALLKDGGLNIAGSVASSGQIAFPATQNPSSDANTLDDYEEGTWTPSDQSGATLTFSNVSAAYTKIGRLVFAQCYLTYPVTANTSQAVIGGLPFTVANSNYNRQGFASLRGASAVAGVYCIPNGTTFAPCTNAGAAVQNDSMSNGTHSFTLIYIAA